MDDKKQTEFLLNLVRRLVSEHVAHLAFFEWVRTVAPKEDFDGILSQCRSDAAIRTAVDATVQSLSVKLAESDELDADRVYREFLRQWTGKGTVN